MTSYENIILSYNHEQWRLNRLKCVVDLITLDFEFPPLQKIAELEDDKGILNVYYYTRLSKYQRLWIKHIWQEENEYIVKFIKYIEKEDNDDEFKYIDFNTNI